VGEAQRLGIEPALDHLLRHRRYAIVQLNEPPARHHQPALAPPPAAARHMHLAAPA